MRISPPFDLINRHHELPKPTPTNTMTSVKSIREGFPFITIAKQPGLPTYKIIAEVHLKLKANASSIVSELGGGAHGLLGLVLPPATYATLTNGAFNAPVNPGTTPSIVAGGC
jgi:hypothetical protein